MVNSVRDGAWVGAAVASLAVVASVLGVYAMVSGSLGHGQVASSPSRRSCHPRHGIPFRLRFDGATKITVPDVLARPWASHQRGSTCWVERRRLRDGQDGSRRRWVTRLGAEAGGRREGTARSLRRFPYRQLRLVERHDRCASDSRVRSQGVHGSRREGHGPLQGRGNHSRSLNAASGSAFLASDSSGPHTCRVTLTPGRYRIYDTIPGHRAAGYEATIIVPEPGDRPLLSADLLPRGKAYARSGEQKICLWS